MLGESSESSVEDILFCPIEAEEKEKTHTTEVNLRNKMK